VKPSWISVSAALLVFAVANTAGAILFFRPIADSDTGTGLLVHPLLAIAVYSGLGVGLLVMATRMTGNPFKAALIIAAAQFILVDVDFVFRGERGVVTAAASAVFIAATWLSAAFAYSRLSSRKADNKS